MLGRPRRDCGGWPAAAEHSGSFGGGTAAACGGGWWCATLPPYWPTSHSQPLVWPGAGGWWRSARVASAAILLVLSGANSGTWAHCVAEDRPRPPPTLAGAVTRTVSVPLSGGEGAIRLQLACGDGSAHGLELWGSAFVLHAWVAPLLAQAPPPWPAGVARRANPRGAEAKNSSCSVRCGPCCGPNQSTRPIGYKPYAANYSIPFLRTPEESSAHGAGPSHGALSPIHLCAGAPGRCSSWGAAVGLPVRAARQRACRRRARVRARSASALEQRISGCAGLALARCLPLPSSPPLADDAALLWARLPGAREGGDRPRESTRQFVHRVEYFIFPEAAGCARCYWHGSTKYAFSPATRKIAPAAVYNPQPARVTGHSAHLSVPGPVTGDTRLRERTLTFPLGVCAPRPRARCSRTTSPACCATCARTPR